MKKIRIQRQHGYYGMLRALHIYVDHIRIGKIKQGQTLEFNLPDRHQKIWGKMDWGKTERLDISDYTLDKTIVFKGYFSFNPFKALGLAELPFNIFQRDVYEAEINSAEQ